MRRSTALLLAIGLAVAVAGCGPRYADCDAARAAGAAPLHRGDPGYSSALDRDGDGTACDR